LRASARSEAISGEKEKQENKEKVLINKLNSAWGDLF